MSNEFKVLLNSVENPNSPHLIAELANCLSIDEDTSQSIINHTPIIILDNLEIRVAASVKEKMRKLLALGAKVIITDDELEETPRVNWPEEEVPEIAFMYDEEAIPGAPQGSSGSPVQPGIFICPTCQAGFHLEPASPAEMEALQKEGVLSFSEVQQPNPSSPPLQEKGEKEREEKSKAPLLVNEKKSTLLEDSLENLEEEFALAIEGIVISDERVLPSESSGLLAAEVLKVEGPSGTPEESPQKVLPNSLLEESTIELDPEDPVIEFNSDDMAKVDSFHEMEALEEVLDEDPISFDDDDDDDEPMSLDDETLSIDDEEEDMDLLEETAPTSLKSAPPKKPAEDIQSISLDDEDSEVDLEALAPGDDWNDDAVDSEDLSVLDSDDTFSAVDDTSSDEFLLDEMLPLYEASSESLAPEEALRLLQDSKKKREAEAWPEEAEDSDELETLDPQEALELLKQSNTPKSNGQSSTSQSAPSKAPKFQKLQTKKKPGPAGSSGSAKIAEGDGPHGVVLSRIMSDDKKDAAAKMISEIKNISINEAKKMTNNMIIPVLKGVTKEIADEVSTRFKSAGISVRVTTRKQ